MNRDLDEVGGEPQKEVSRQELPNIWGTQKRGGARGEDEVERQMGAKCHARQTTLIITN